MKILFEDYVSIVRLLLNLLFAIVIGGIVGFFINSSFIIILLLGLVLSFFSLSPILSGKVPYKIKIIEDSQGNYIILYCSIILKREKKFNIQDIKVGFVNEVLARGGKSKVFRLTKSSNGNKIQDIIPNTSGWSKESLKSLVFSIEDVKKK